MTTKHEVIDAHLQHPTATSTELARLLGCHPAYVRATAQRSGLSLPGAMGQRVPREPRPPARCRIEAKAATRAALLVAARRLWAEPGTYETQGIREIAAAAGYSTGAIFNNFTGKEDLWREAMGYEPPVDGPEVRALLQRMAQLKAAA